MKKLFLVPVVMFLIALSPMAFAAPSDPGQPAAQGQHKPEHKGFHKHHRCHCHEFGPRLNLTQEQKAKMKEIRGRFQADVHDLKYDIRIKKLEVRKLFTDPKTDDATLLAKEKELNLLKAQLMDKKAEMKVEWRKILTPEQIQMLDRIHRHHGYHHGWRHHGHHDGWRHHHGHRGPMGKKGPQQKPAADMSH